MSFDCFEEAQTFDVRSFELLTPTGKEKSLSACSFAMRFFIGRDASSFDEETLSELGEYRDYYRERIGYNAEVLKMKIKEKVHELYELLEAMLDRLHEDDLAAELRAIEKDVGALVESLKRILVSAQDK